jgi:hypothetical protein
MGIAFGEIVHGEFASADASGLNETNSRFTIYPQAGTTAITLGANDYVTITDIIFSSAGTNLVCTVYDGADATVDAGEIVSRNIVATNGVTTVRLASPHVCQKGTYPKVKTSGAGQVYVQFKGGYLKR